MEKPERLSDEVRVAFGITKDGRGVMTVGSQQLTLTADMADEMSASLRELALELRNGGRQC